MTDKKKPEAPAEFSTNLHNIFATNESLEETGAWVVVNDLMGIRMKIRRLRADSVVKAFERIMREQFTEEYLRKPQDMTEEQGMLVLQRQLAEAVIVDWKGVRDSNTGEEIPYSPEFALQLMKMKDFREFVYQAANERDTFRDKSDKAAAGNS